MKTENRLKLTQFAKELQLANERKTAKVPIFKAILTTTDGDEAYYFESLKALNEFAKHAQNFGLQLFQLVPTAQKINLNTLLLKLVVKCKNFYAQQQRIYAEKTALKQQKKDISSSEFYTPKEKAEYKRGIDEQIAKIVARYNEFYGKYTQNALAQLEWLKNAVASKWVNVEAVRLNTAILRKYN